MQKKDKRNEGKDKKLAHNPPTTQEVTLCGICARPIDKENDNYIRITDYLNGQFWVEGFYHTNCYIQKIKSPNSDKELEVMKKMVFNLLQRSNLMLDNVGVDKVVDIR